MRASWWLMRDDEGNPALLGAESGALTTIHAPDPARKSNGGGCIVVRAS
jgi:hypothetical protein